MFGDYEFAVCLTHDVDRPYKTYQSIYYAVRERRAAHLSDLLPGRNPYWQFEEIMTLEDDYDVRSAFYVLNEPHLVRKGLSALVNPNDWIQHLGRYDVRDPAMADVIRRLHAGGWEVGLHGSYHSFDDVDRLRREKQVLEDCLDDPVIGGRQHYLNLSIPDTWRHHAEIGLRYDASLGSARTSGFRHGYRPLRPFGDRFVVFPLTLMEQTLPDPATNFDDALAVCTGLLAEADDHDAVMSVLWHPRYFSEADFPGYRELYRRLIERALDRGAWVGPPAGCYRKLRLETDCAPTPHRRRNGLTKA